MQQLVQQARRGSECKHGGMAPPSSRVRMQQTRQPSTTPTQLQYQCHEDHKRSQDGAAHEVPAEGSVGSKGN